MHNCSIKFPITYFFKAQTRFFENLIILFKNPGMESYMHHTSKIASLQLPLFLRFQTNVQSHKFENFDYVTNVFLVGR